MACVPFFAEHLCVLCRQVIAETVQSSNDSITEEAIATLRNLSSCADRSALQSLQSVTTLKAMVAALTATEAASEHSATLMWKVPSTCNSEDECIALSMRLIELGAMPLLIDALRAAKTFRVQAQLVSALCDLSFYLESSGKQQLIELGVIQLLGPVSPSTFQQLVCMFRLSDRLRHKAPRMGGLATHTQSTSIVTREECCPFFFVRGEFDPQLGIRAPIVRMAPS